MTTGDVDRDALQRRLTAVLGDEGGDWPALRAAVVVARGVAGLGVAEAADRLGITAEQVIALERGEIHPALAPPALASWVPEVDWKALGVDVPPPPDAPARARHPAARRPARVRVGPPP
jgi:hypothetical protein